MSLYDSIYISHIILTKLLSFSYYVLGYKCGDVAYYCPLGSSYPRAVQSGYYSLGGGE